MRSGPRMLPAVLPPEIRAEPKRSAEVQVYDRLRDDPLLADCLVLYSCRWVGAYQGILRDGEADFVVAHPQLGFLVLEVKGGRVSRSAADGKWTTLDRNDVLHPIEDPVAQAVKSKKVILHALMKSWPGKAGFIRARHGIVLPQSWRPASASALGAALPPELLACRDEMPKLGAHLLQMLAWSPPDTREPAGGLGTLGVSLLETFYGRDLDFAPRLVSVIAECEAEIGRLTATQARYLDLLSTLPVALIEGGAGTGKTTLAVERAKRAASEGRKVLLLCFNRPLRSALGRELVGSAASVATFHEFCGRMGSIVGKDIDLLRSQVGDRRFWRDALPGLLFEIGLSEPPERYDDLIIDEGQDFRAEWVDALRLFLNPGASLFVFRDDFQNIFDGADLAVLLGVNPMPLCENVRNSQEVFAVANGFRSGPAQRCLGPGGGEVRWIEAPSARTVRIVERELNRLLDVEGIPAHEIAVLTGSGLETSPFAGGLPGARTSTTADEPRDGAVILDTVRRFKGLDSSVVLLCSMEGDIDLAYVGLSRARTLLIVVGSVECLDQLGRPG